MGVLIALALVIGIVLERGRSESFRAQLAWLERLSSAKFGDCEPLPRGPQKSVCYATEGIKHAADNEALAQQLADRALIYLHMKQGWLALRDANRSLSLSGVSPQTRGMNLQIRGIVRTDLGDASGADDDLTKALALVQPQERWSVLYDRGYGRLRHGNPKGALADFSGAIIGLNKFRDQYLTDQQSSRKSSVIPDVRIPAAEYRKLLSSWKASVARALARIYAERAEAERQLGQCAPSLSDYAQALILKPDDPAFYYGRAWTKFSCGNWRGGIDDLWVHEKLAMRWS